MKGDLFLKKEEEKEEKKKKKRLQFQSRYEGLLYSFSHGLFFFFARLMKDIYVYMYGGWVGVIA